MTTDQADPVPSVWRAPHLYRVGDRCRWWGDRHQEPILLVCARSHYAGADAEYPWDPGYGWPAAKAATLWSPGGDVEAAKLRAAVSALCDDAAKPDANERLRLMARRMTAIVEELTRQPIC